jgi:hypothetical protein
MHHRSNNAVYLTSGWPLRVVSMSGVAKGVRVMATSTPAQQKSNTRYTEFRLPTVALCGPQGGRIGYTLQHSSQYVWRACAAVGSPAASVIDSSTGGTPLTNGMPGTCMLTHGMLGGIPVAAGCPHNSKHGLPSQVRAGACSFGLRAFGRRSLQCMVTCKLQCACNPK